MKVPGLILALGLTLVAAIAATGPAPDAARAPGSLATASLPAHHPGVGRVTAVVPKPGRSSAARARAARAQLHDGLHAVWSDVRAIPRVRAGGPIVAIVDSGADLRHPSLREHLWINSGEVPDNGVDDDRNGYVDDVNGVNILTPGDQPDGPGSAHGTAVAGLVSAGVQGRAGVTGAAPGVRLMIVRVFGVDGQGNTTQLAEGIEYAVRSGASVINCSLTTDAGYATVDRAIESAAEAGIPVVAAAGNDGRSLDLHPIYPAATESPAVIAVAAATASGKLAGFSNFGRSTVDVAAPGVDLMTTAPRAAFTTMSGTSAAAPLVSATLALERAVKPEATLSELREALLATAAHTGLPIGGGELDAEAAVGSLAGAGAGIPAGTTVEPTLIRRGDRLLVSTRWRLAGEPAAPVRAVVRIRAGSATGRILVSRRLTLQGARGTILTPAARGLGRLWLELETSSTAQRAGERVGRPVSAR